MRTVDVIRHRVRKAMDAREFITIGMSAERIVGVTPDMTVRHFVPTMPAVYAIALPTQG
jgi:hypothetical protein